MEDTLLILAVLGVVGLMIFFTWKFNSSPTPPSEVKIIERVVQEDPYRFWTNSYWRRPHAYHAGFGRHHRVNRVGYRL